MDETFEGRFAQLQLLWGNIAARPMRAFVEGGIYRARGALFRTMETVAVDTPLSWATSRKVTATFFLRRLTDSLHASSARDFRLRRAVFFIICNDVGPAERIGKQLNESAYY